jgi:hygromycin-B 4-O-kinase
LKTFKPQMNAEDAAELLRRVTGSEVADLASIDMGEMSQVYSYTSQGRSYVIHFKAQRDNLEKARYLYDRYASAGLPMPRIYEIGEAGGIYYAISDLVPGRSVSALTGEALEAVMPNLVKLFVRMSRIEVDAPPGWGWMMPSGEAASSSWTDYIAGTFAPEQHGFYEGWMSLFEGGILEQGVFERVYAAMMELAKHAPQERYLVHGDYHLGNMLASGGEITGIVDWEMGMYGDFMYDVAVLNLWSPQAGFPQRVREAWAAEGRDIPFFKERLLCYQIFKGLDGLRFYAKKGDRPSYEFMKVQLLAMLKIVEG